MASARNKRKMSRIQIAGLTLGGLFLVAFTALGILWVLSLGGEDELARFQAQVDALGVWGWFLLLGIQYIQIVVAFIPGGPIQIVAGALYGPLGGMVICLVGTVLATMTVFSLVQRFGRRVILLFVEEKDIMKYDFLKDSRKLDFLVVLLFFIPGTPKDALTYLFALTSISLGRFMILSTCARMPAMLTSVLTGDSAMNQDWLKAGILFGVIAIISGLGLLLHRKIAGRLHGKSEK